jgi:hypothetical protein
VQNPQTLLPFVQLQKYFMHKKTTSQYSNDITTQKVKAMPQDPGGK